LIDWLTVIVPCRHHGKVNGGRVLSVCPDGEIEWETEKKAQIRGSFESSILVRSQGDRLLFIDGNPVKWLQGHNLFGSDDLCSIVDLTMTRLTEILNLQPTADDRADWRDGNFDVKTVDCTAMWELRNRADARAWLRAAEFQSKSRHGRPTVRGGTLYFGQHSRRWSVKFYSKGDELDARKHHLPDDLPNRDKLYEWADNKLRGELRLHSLELKDLGMTSGRRWKTVSPIKLLLSRIDTLNMADQFSLTPEIVDGLPARLVAVYKLWKDGEDLRGMYPRATFYRYRKELLKHGIEIAVRQPAVSQNVIPLVRALRPEAIAQVPDWAIDTPLYIDTRSAKRA
jgi:II/X family phage/plasmid replication protein